MRTSQLRLYTIREGNLDEFVRAWSTGVVPLRRKHGYEVEAAWRVADERRFCWVVSYAGPLTWDEAEAGYYGSPERAALDPDPAQWVEEQQLVRRTGRDYALTMPTVQGLSKKAANYRPSTSPQVRCAECTFMFPKLAIGGCRYVRGVIHADDVCDEFMPARGARPPGSS